MTPLMLILNVDNLIDYGLLSPKKEIHGDVLEISDFYINEIKKIKSKYNSDVYPWNTSRFILI